MTIHDWTRVPAGLFHSFHQTWSVAIANALNAGRLPKDYFALVESKVNGREPDVIALQTDPNRKSKRPRPGGGLAVAEPPRTRVVTSIESDAASYARRANRVVIRHHIGTVVAAIELVSPGNKDGPGPLRKFIEKAVDFLSAGVHLLIVDLFPPGPRDPQGLHKLIFDEFREQPFELPAGQPLTFVSYHATEPLTAYLEPRGVGDPVPDMPVFLNAEQHVLVPLAETYAATWAVFPEPVRELAGGPTPKRNRRPGRSP